MITPEGIKFKNQKIEEMLLAQIEDSKAIEGKSMEEVAAFLKKKNRQQQGESLISGFWYSFLNDAMMNHIDNNDWFDFTYETLPKLSLAIAALFRMQKDSYSEEMNRDIIGKTMATVLYGLAMNEHNCNIRVTHMADKGKINTDYDWSYDMSLKIGLKREIDFREAGLLSVRNVPVEVEGGMYISVDPLIKAYKSTIGVNLADYGFGDIMIGG